MDWGTEAINCPLLLLLLHNTIPLVYRVWAATKHGGSAKEYQALLANLASAPAAPTDAPAVTWPLGLGAEGDAHGAADVGGGSGDVG